MKTVGQLLQTTRHKQSLTLDQVSHAIKIHSKYLQALESDEYHKLPSATYARGFIKNYAQFLNINPQTLLAIFRRDFAESESGQIIPRSMIESTPASPWWYSRIIVFTIVGFTLALFSGFLAFQYTSLIKPKLIVTLPIEGQVVSESTVQVVGIADPTSVVKINNQLISLDNSGKFQVKIPVNSGRQQIIIQAINRRKNETIVKRTINVKYPNS